jgi:hypothetical protein
MTEPSPVVAELLNQSAPAEPAPEPEKTTPEPAAPEPAQAAAPEPEPSGTPDEAKPAPQSIKEYAEANDLDVSVLYGLTDANGKTLSELSNQARDKDRLDTSKVEHSRKEAEFRAEQAKFNQMVEDWAALVQAGENTPQALQRVQAEREARTKAFETQTLAVIPEWGDLTVKTADQQRINAFASRFGAPEGVAEALTAPWANLMMRYVLDLEDHFSSALTKVAKAKNKAIKPPGKDKSPALTPSGLNPQAEAALKSLRQN